MSFRWALEGTLFVPPGRWQYGRVVIQGNRIESVVPLSAPAADNSGHALGAVRANAAGRTSDGPGVSDALDPHALSANPDFILLAGPMPTWRLGADLRLIPGFVDGHTHLLGVGLAPLKPALTGAVSKEDVLERMTAWLDAHPGSDPVVGEGWDQSLWSKPALPTRAELDRIAAHRPVAVRRVCGHVAVLNSLALERAGSSWPNVNAETGEAREDLPLALSRIWPPSVEERDEAIQVGQREAWKQGVTGIQDMGQRTGFAAFVRAAEAGRLALRVTQFIGIEGFDWLLGQDPAGDSTGNTEALAREFLRLGGVKLFLDGSLGGRSAAVRDPYPGTTGDSGLLLWKTDRLQAVLERAARAGWQATMHAIGDRAIEQAIETVESMTASGVSMTSPGFRIEHAEMLRPDLLDRGTAAGFLFSMQPNFTTRWQHPGELYEAVLGAERAMALNPYRSVAARGRLLFGSDCMPLGPLFGLRGALLHPIETERLSPEEAVAAYTASSAAGVACPFEQGRLAEGVLADIAVLHWSSSADPSVAATWVDGVLRYLAP